MKVVLKLKWGSKEPKGLSIAPKTLASFLERKTQLYEQGATVRRIGQYVRNWYRWVKEDQRKLWKFPQLQPPNPAKSLLRI